MPATVPEILQAVPVPRQQYLAQNEARLRSLALPQNTSDPIIARHLEFVIWLEDAIDIHEIAATKHRNAGASRVAEVHVDYARKIAQIKFHHLDQLAHLLV
jgi:hypothetical protein